MLLTLRFFHLSMDNGFPNVELWAFISRDFNLNGCRLLLMFFIKPVSQNGISGRSVYPLEQSKHLSDIWIRVSIIGRSIEHFKHSMRRMLKLSDKFPQGSSQLLLLVEPTFSPVRYNESPQYVAIVSPSTQLLPIFRPETAALLSQSLNRALGHSNVVRRCLRLKALKQVEEFDRAVRKTLGSLFLHSSTNPLVACERVAWIVQPETCRCRALD